jgi:hypothetical protein
MNRAWSLAKLAAVTEWRMYVGAARLVGRRPDVPEGAEPVRYVGAVSVLLWAFTVVSAVELVALHLIIPWHGVRIAADVLGIWGLVWCLGLTGCHYVYPHLVTATTLRVRHSAARDVVTVPLDLVEGVRVRERGIDEGKERQVADGVGLVGVGKRTNVEIRLRRPVAMTVAGVTHEVEEVRVFADDPRALARRLALTPEGGGTGRS